MAYAHGWMAHGSHSPEQGYQGLGVGWPENSFFCDNLGDEGAVDDIESGVGRRTRPWSSPGLAARSGCHPRWGSSGRWWRWDPEREGNAVMLGQDTHAAGANLVGLAATLSYPTKQVLTQSLFITMDAMLSQIKVTPYCVARRR